MKNKLVITNSLNNFNPIPPSDDDDDDINGGGGGNGGGGNGNGKSGGGFGGMMNPFSGMFGDDDGIDVEKTILVNYNEKFKNASPALFRDEVIRQTMSCLIGMTKPNALLIGPAGCGKTKIAEEIARRIANNDETIPEQLVGCTIYELPISNLVAGSSLVGDLEKKVKSVIEFLTDPKNKAIVFIDEIHMLGNTHDGTYSKIAQILKPALARSDMKTIGSTTTQEANAIANDPAFNRRFTRLIVDELTQEQTKTILKLMATDFFNHYGQTIFIDDEVINDVVNTADMNKTMTSHRPDNAITLLDRSMADAYIDLKHRIAELEKTDHNAAVTLSNSIPLRLSCSQMQKTALKLLTGNNKKTIPTIEQLKSAFVTVKGQNDIVSELISYIHRDNLQLFPREKPLSFLFAGPTGVGKSEIAKLLANTLTGLKPIVINMSEMDSNMSITRIIGSSAGYVGSDSKKELPFDILETNPYQVILLDEFEKAHESVQQLFMSALDEGYIKDSKNKIIDFSRSIIIATTNAGYDSDDRSLNIIQDGTENDASTEKLAEDIKPEIVNRFTKTFTFHPITQRLFARIISDKYNRNVARIKGIKSSYKYLPDNLDAKSLAALVEKNYDPVLGARHTYDIAKAYIEDLVIAHDVAETEKANSGINSDKPFVIVDDDDDVVDEYLDEVEAASDTKSE